MSRAPSCLGRAALLIVLSSTVGCADEDEAPPPPPTDVTHPRDDSLRFQHLQAKSTHNSYHVEPEGNDLVDWRYTHLPLDDQLESQGVRHFELDLRFSPALGAFEVYHLPVIDEETTCRLFVDCLASIASWSDAHPGHHPIVVQLELKDGLPADGEAYFGALHDAILTHWASEEIITPASVRGDASTVGEAIAAAGWPTLGVLRGRVMFTMNNRGEHREAYTHGGTALDGRLVFPESDPGDPYAAIAVINDPFDAEAIDAALAANMLVRTRADAGVAEAEAGETARRDAALASGAHFVTTDFPAPVEQHDYWLDIPGGTPSRCNPVTAPTPCDATDVEDPSLLGD